MPQLSDELMPVTVCDEWRALRLCGRSGSTLQEPEREAAFPRGSMLAAAHSRVVCAPLSGSALCEVLR
jgi:hypothetical protein